MRVEQFRWQEEYGWEPGRPGGSLSGAQLALGFGCPRLLLKAGDQLGEIRRAYPAAQLFGCSTAGEIFGTQVSEDALVLTAVELEHTRLRSTHVGIDDAEDSFDAAYRLPPVDFENDQDTGPAFGKPLTPLKGKGTLMRPAGYAMLELKPFSTLKLLPGVRADYDSGSQKWTADPRVAARWDVHAGYPRTTIKGGAGLFHQPPEVYETIEPFGNKGLSSESAGHYSLGFEQELAPPVELSLEGFYKDLNGLVVSAPNINGSENGISYQNLGSGRAYGSELLLRYKPGNGGRFFGWVAYTLSRSERKDSDSEDYYRYDYDQTHIVTALASYKLGRGWQIGGRFRYVTGSPYTPEIGGTVDYDAGTYAPVSSLSRNSKRLPAFHQLDVRVDKTWQFRAWALSAYLDVQNAYNHQNTESIGYNFDYSQTSATKGLPLLPIVGIRGEL